MGAAVAVPVAVGVAIVVSTGEGNGVSAGVCVAVAVGSLVAVSVGASVGACVGVSAGVSAGAAVGASVAVLVGSAAGDDSADGVAVGVGSSAGAGAPSTAANMAALAREMAKMRRVKGERRRGGDPVPPGVGIGGAPLEPRGWGSDPIARYLSLKLRSRSAWSATLDRQVDAAALQILIAGPDDAAALAGTTRLGFDSYRAWAPAGWRPPEHALELRAIRERLRHPTTWCAIALDPEGEPAGHVGITHASERLRRHVRIPGRAHLWMLFVRPPWWGSGLAGRLHGLALEEAVRRGYTTIRLYTPAGQARARAFYEREGWELAGPGFFEPELDLDLVEYRRALGG